jgi:hypothetical protein
MFFASTVEKRNRKKRTARPTLATIDLGNWLNLKNGLYLECLEKSKNKA